MEALIYSVHTDETTILSTILQQAGISFRSIKDIDLVTESILQRPADLALLSLQGETERYLQHVRQMRVHTAMPILLIVDPVPEDQLVDLMDAGADWTVTRPFGVRLLASQIRNTLRRGGGLPYHALPSLTQSGVSIDPATRTVTVGDRDPKRLTQLEFRMLYTLITHPGQIIPTENLVEYVWGYSGEGNRELVRGLVQRLRVKVEPDQGNPTYILTEPGIGYCFVRGTPELSYPDKS